MDSSPPRADADQNHSDAEAEAAKKAKIARRSRFLGGLIYLFARMIYATLRLKIVNEEKLEFGREGTILVTWHGRSFIPANLFRARGFWALISLSRDGEMQNNIFQRLGFHTIRGSTGRGGVKGALQMARKVKEGGVLAFTPDGPRGPTHKVQLGVILMAEKSGAPIIPLGISADRRHLFRSWDSYFIPNFFSRAYVVVGEEIRVPADLDEAERMRYAGIVEIAINRAEREAEQLAGHNSYPAEWRID